MSGNKSKTLFERAKKVLPGGVNSPVRAFEPYPFFVDHAKAQNCTVQTTTHYIDYCMAYGAMLLGHAQPDIMEAVKNQLPKGSLYGAPTEREVEFAELISKIFALHGNAAARKLRHRSHNARNPSSKRLHGQKKNHKVRRLLPRLTRQRSW